MEHTQTSTSIRTGSSSWSVAVPSLFYVSFMLQATRVSRLHTYMHSRIVCIFQFACCSLFAGRTPS